MYQSGLVISSSFYVAQMDPPTSSTHDVGQTQAQLSRKLLFSVVRLFLSFYNEGWGGLYSKPSKGPWYPVQRGRFLSRPLEAINPRVEASSKSEN